MKPASLLSGTSLDSWRVLGLCGLGSYGAVYRAEQVGNEGAGPFALKLALHPLDPRFEREGELLSRLTHRHVPKLHGRGWWSPPRGGPFPYVVMDWVEGVSLYAWAAQQPRTSRQILTLLAQVARALEATHAVEGVHRDVKGDNILVRKEDGRAVLMDFGSGNYPGSRPLTHQLPPPGTPKYQSPECMRFQWEWRHQQLARYDARPTDDLYALGVTAYRMVTGRYPPPAGDLKVTEEGFQLVHPPWVPPETWVSLSPELAALIHRLLLEEPTARGTSAQLAQALEDAATRADPTADLPITPLPPQAPTPPKGQRSAPSGMAEPLWLMVAASLFLAIGVWWTSGRPSSSTSQEATAELPARDTEDAGTAGLADSVSTTPVRTVPIASAQAGLHLDIPKKPFPGQSLPPCAKPQVEINGGCWIRYSDVTPPCGAGSYEWRKACFWPILGPPRPATSNP
ncbi:serine/threonine-protein kinase [Stigmatella sp. ncwal1]|uniref:Serine/threonine-protein kinase n=1 Tax=Stigmatella ashevillensis TaxID=2995309 RepID=A0ABT5DHD4_9BACT|nr:serine/threonine-protein kinase [Stigmatella ashevillena]MDC0712494.1 serine/threonine-protein kinase [Stigmatella ashevillena]